MELTQLLLLSLAITFAVLDHRHRRQLQAFVLNGTRSMNLTQSYGRKFVFGLFCIGAVILTSLIVPAAVSTFTLGAIVSIYVAFAGGNVAATYVTKASPQLQPLQPQSGPPEGC